MRRAASTAAAVSMRDRCSSATPICIRCWACRPASRHGARHGNTRSPTTSRARCRSSAAPRRSRMDRNNITLDPRRQGPLGTSVDLASPTWTTPTTSPWHGSCSTVHGDARGAAGAAKSGRSESRRRRAARTCSAPAAWATIPATSVVDRDHRSHDIPNLFICDGSSFVTSGRGQPTMTIMALAFRAADRIKAAAAAGTI